MRCRGPLRAVPACHPTEIARAASAAGLVRTDYVLVEPTVTVFDLLVLIQRTRAALAVVVDLEAAPRPGPTGPHPNVLGVITKAHIAEAIAEGMELFED